MPSAEELPPPLDDLARRNALELSDARWRYDVDRLISTAERVLAAPSRESGRPPADVPVDDRARELSATPGRLRRHSRLAISAAVLVVLLGVLAGVLAGGGDDDEASAESRLMEVIPANVQEAGCERSRPEDDWMRDHGAVLQDDCQLPRSVLSDDVSGGDVTYGLFPSFAKAQDLVETDYSGELRNGATSCNDEAARLKPGYRGGNARCYSNTEGVFISWTYPDSGVAAQLYLDPDTSVDAAVEVRSKIL